MQSKDNTVTGWPEKYFNFKTIEYGWTMRARDLCCNGGKFNDSFCLVERIMPVKIWENGRKYNNRIGRYFFQLVLVVENLE